MAQKPPYVLDPQDASSGRPATFIFLHGYGDDAEGLPLGLGQQFQFASKLPHLRWVFPNAPMNRDAQGQAWYTPKALPTPMKPRVLGHEEENEMVPDDEEGILTAVAYLDGIVKQEIEKLKGEGSRVVVGGFSQGCAVSMVWGLVGEQRREVGGLVGLSGYFPLAGKVEEIRKENEDEKYGSNEGAKKWFMVHGSKDMLVPVRLFAEGQQNLEKFVNKENIEGHVYDGMGHSTSAAELRDLLGWLEKMVPP